jgi:hypothetical protein
MQRGILALERRGLIYPSISRTAAQEIMQRETILAHIALPSEGPKIGNYSLA